MSSSIEIHIWLSSRIHSADLFVKAASCIDKTSYNEPGFGIHPRFRRLVVEQGSPLSDVLDQRLNTNNSQDLLTALRNFEGSDYMYRLESVVQLKEFNLDKGAIEDTVAPMTFKSYGSRFGIDDYYRRWQGDIEVYFPLREFLIPAELIDRAEKENPRQRLKWMTMITELSKNIESLHGLAIKLIEALAPELVVVCTNLEIHPLTAHALYHRAIREFVEDLNWIHELHVRGGFYGQHVTKNDPLYQKPRAVSKDYGYLREIKASNWPLTDLFDYLARSRPDPSLIPEETIREVLVEAGNTTAVTIENSLYLQNDDAAWGYLQQPFEALANTFAGDR